MTETKQQIPLGRVNGLYGVQGWVKIYSYTDPITNIFNYTPWQVEKNGQWHTISICASKTLNKGLVAQFTNCHNRDEASDWLDAEIAVYRAQLPPSTEGEYYWTDLIGLTVKDLDDRILGRVDRLLETGANDVLVVVGEKEQLIPFLLDKTIKQIDLMTGILQVDWDPDF
jgi:16S rRNA processing protein RimM